MITRYTILSDVRDNLLRKIARINKQLSYLSALELSDVSTADYTSYVQSLKNELVELNFVINNINIDTTNN